MASLLEHRLMLSPGCTLQRRGDVLTLSTRDMEIELRSPHTDRVAALLAALRRGVRPLDVLDAGETGAELERLLGDLQQEHLIVDLDVRQEALPLQEMVDSLLSEARFWANRIFEQPFWDDLMAGRCRKSQVLGWGVEFYHFVDGANHYMPLGVANARVHTDVRTAIARHYVEEMNHGTIFLEGLVRCGLDRDSVLRAPPLPHTQALLNHLAELAIEGAVPYTAAFAVMQPGLSAPSVHALDDFYGHLSRLYPYAAELFRAFNMHARFDVDLAHERTVFETLCRHANGLSVQDRERASAAMQSVSEAFILFFEGIANIAGAQEFAPRRPFGIEASL